VDVIRRATPVPLPHDERVLATHPDTRPAFVRSRGCDRSTLRLEHRAAVGDPGSVDVAVLVSPVVGPGEQVVRSVETDARRVLLPRRSRYGDPGRIEHRA